MNQELKEDLQNLECVGNIAKLPTNQLNNYSLLKNTLTKACGKYKRNTFEFPYPAQIIINTLLTGKIIDFKKEFQFFATPLELAEYVTDQIIWDKQKIDILEPSAGHGVFIDTVLNRIPSVKKSVDAVELSDLNFSILQNKYKDVENVSLIQGDFLRFHPGKKYDLIIANPPFSKNQDIIHIRKMYSLLKEGGQLITIASKSWTFGNQRKQVIFREWLENEVAANWFDLDQGSFKSSGTNVAGVLITICK